MSANSIVKSSSVEDKRPTSGQLGVSEISLNYNEEGAFLCCKDSAGNIQQVGGVKISETEPGTPVKQTVWFQPSTGTISIYNGTNWLAGGSAAVVSVNGKTGVVVLTSSDVGAASAAQGSKADLALQPGDDISELNNNLNYLAKDDNVSELANDAGYITDAEVTGNYLSLDSTAGAQTVQSTDVTEFKGGILVPDGELISLTNTTATATLDIDSLGLTTLTSSDKLNFTAQDGLFIPGTFSSSNLVKLTGKSQSPWATNNQDYVFIYPRIDDTPTFNESDSSTYIANFTCANLSIFYGSVGTQNPNVQNKYGLKIGSTVGQDTWPGVAESNSYGVYSDLPKGVSNKKVFNYYASGNAQNFFQGELHVGGDTGGTVIGENTKVEVRPSGAVAAAAYVFGKGGSNLAGVEFSGLYYSASSTINVIRAVQSARGAASNVTCLEIIPYAYDYLLEDNVDVATCIGLDVKGVKTATGSGPDSVVDVAFGINIASTSGSKLAINGIAYALYSSQVNITSASGATAYNIYIQGTAPSYFGGTIRTGQVTNPGGTSGGTSDVATDDNPYGWEKTNGNSNATRLTDTELNMARFSASGSGSNISINRLGSANGTFINFAENGIPVDKIRLDGSGGITYGTSDYRLKENVIDLPSSIDAIKALRPVNYNFLTHPGQTRPGFIAHELAEVFPAAVTGKKDEEESIGNLYEYDGSLIEAHVPKPSEDQMTYEEEVEGDEISAYYTRTRTWTANGKEPIYQTVDETKIVPHLAKALQEALIMIETLEARLTAAGIA